MPKKRPARIRTSDAEIGAALARAKRAKAGARIMAVHFDTDEDKMIVQLSTGATISLPRRAIPEFKAIPPDALVDLAVDPAGYSIWSSAADAGLQIEGLVQAASGVAVRDVAARMLGRSKSSAKASASRANGAKGGRPRGTNGVVRSAKKAS